MSGSPERVETLIVGGGQAGLAVGYHLAKRDRPFVITDANERIGDPWRRRWDSLRLFTQARYSGLPGAPFPAPRWSYPTKDAVADYLEAYADRFELPVRTGVRVDSISKSGERFIATCGTCCIEADHVVVATGAYSTPRLPGFSAELDPATVQLHSSEYRNPSQLQPGSVVVIGAGNSGAEIALEVSTTHPTWLSGRDTGHLPWRLDTIWDRILTPVVWFVGSRVMNVNTPVGRRARPKLLKTGHPLERVQPRDLQAAGIERAPRTVGAHNGQPVFEDGRSLQVSNVVWCTGFRPDFSWIDLPVFDDAGEPLHHRGVVTTEPGLYFVGRFFLASMTSSLLGGVGRDAEHIAHHIATVGSRERAHVAQRRFARHIGEAP